MTATLDDAPLTIEERRAAYEAKMYASFDPTVPGIPGDGSPVILHTDQTRNLTYAWYDISRRIQDFSVRERGYLVSRLSVTHGGVDGLEVGYLNVSHTTKELVASVFPTPFHWADENTSASFGFDWRREQGREVTAQEIWATAHTHLRMRPPSAEGTGGWGTYSASDAPTDPAVLAAEIATVEAIYAKQMRGFVRCLSTPMVDYSHVDDQFDAAMKPEHPGPLRGTGIGRSMYLLAAQHLAQHGKVLRASGLQSTEAEGLWARLIADPTVPTRKTQSTFYKPIEQQTRTYWCLDYTRRPVAAPSTSQATR